ncbi:TPA: hypothetical protein MIH20_10190 [Klebsiella pneumoniae]|nr:hypothetical protein [Klebsiella pneumoniae]
MLYRYAAFSKKHNALHFSILFTLVVCFFTHVGFLLEYENIWLLLGIFIYLPILACWCCVSTWRDRMAD